MSISIVTVTLNAASDLPLTIESVAQQDYGPVEFIVVDGGSRDGTHAVLERYRDCIDRILHVEDAGIFAAMNHALDHCRNDFVLFLNAGDTLFAPDTLSVMMACRRPDTDVFYGNHVYIDGKREFFKRSLDFGVLAERLLHGDIDHPWLAHIPGHQATFARVDLLRCLRFDTGIEICADHDVLLRAYRAGARFQFIDQTVSHYVAGGYSARHHGRLALEWCAAYREHSLRPAEVDAFFLGTAASPFGPQNALTGAWLCGNDRYQGADPTQGIEKPVHWCRPDGAQLLAPAADVSTGLTIEGFNPFEDQRLLLSAGSERVGAADLAVGWFRTRVAFASVLAAGSVVALAFTRQGEIGPDHPGPVGAGIAGFAFRLAFDVPAPLRCGETLAFCAENAGRTRAMLGSGWSKQEARHVWSVGAQADLTVPIAPGANELAIHCSGNPFIADERRRGVEVVIDDVGRGVQLLTPGEATEMRFALPTAEAERSVHLVLRPLTQQSSPEDRRQLGVCLTAIGCRRSSGGGEGATRSAEAVTGSATRPPRGSA